VADAQLSIRLDLPNGDRIGPGKIALLEAIRSEGSISAAARRLGMPYRRAWVLVEQINEALRQPAVATVIGGEHGGGAVVTPAGERIIEIYRTIEVFTRRSAHEEFRAIAMLVHRGKRRQTK